MTLFNNGDLSEPTRTLTHKSTRSPTLTRKENWAKLEIIRLGSGFFLACYVHCDVGCDGMLRVLMIGSYSQKLKVDAKHEKIAIQTIHRELHYADEANLLEERDMHVFDSRPLKDPLHLVCCNACKKPVKASQYPAHAELCRSFISTEDVSMEFDCINGYKEPLKKGRFFLQTRDPGKEKYESLMGDDGTTSDYITDDPNDMLHSHSGDVHRIKFCKISKAGNISSDDYLTKNEMSTKVFVCDLHSSAKVMSDAPTPLATKIYHLQRSQRLRASLGHLYHQTYAKNQDIGSLSLNSMLGKAVHSPEISYLN